MQSKRNINFTSADQDVIQNKENRSVVPFSNPRSITISVNYRSALNPVITLNQVSVKYPPEKK